MAFGVGDLARRSHINFMALFGRFVGHFQGI